MMLFFFVDVHTHEFAFRLEMRFTNGRAATTKLNQKMYQKMLIEPKKKILFKQISGCVYALQCNRMEACENLN